MVRRKRSRSKWVGGLLAGVAALLMLSTALAAEFRSENIVRIAAGQVIDDDLYVVGQEVIIDGTVNGDLIAAASYIEINGTVTGDVWATGASIVINGTVEDDVRAAGAGIDVNGTIGSDLLVAGGGVPGGGAGSSINTGNRTIQQGIRIADGAQIGGDAIVSGGTARIGGNVGRNLLSTAGATVLAAQVGGNAGVDANTLTIEDTTSINGTLRYTTPTETTVPPETAASVQYNSPPPAPTLQEELIQRAIRAGLILVGLLLLGGLLFLILPQSLRRPAQSIRFRTGSALL